MKITHCTLLVILALAGNAMADTIVQWNFNSVPPDGTSNTGTNAPSIGAGTIGVIGTVIQNSSPTQQYTSGDGSSDPATVDDSAYHTRNYPLQGDSNKTSGIEVRVSTVGYESINVTWDQRNSATASKYFRFQYSLDGTTFVDYDVLRMDVTTFVNGRTINLSPTLGANGNPNFAFRVVSEFESTATGSGTAGFVTTTPGTYSPNGTIRFDMLTVSGSLPDGNSFPTISFIPSQTSRVDTATAPLPFEVGDVETPADQLTVNASSSNQTLVPDYGIILDGTGANRTVTLVPNFDQTGTTTITISVIDGGGKSNRTSFLLTVLPANTPPALSTFTNVHTVASTPFAPIGFTVSDAEQSADSLTVTASSSDQTVIPDANLFVSGTGSDRILTISPDPGQVGNAVITVTVSDGSSTASRTFNAMVVPSNGVVFSEPFNYADGSMVANSARLWTTRAGTPGQMQIVAGTVLVTGSQSEDVVARLIGGPYDTSSSTVLYASFEVTFSALPAAVPDIFTHFSATDANTLRARVLPSTTNAAPGYFRLGIANTTSSASNVVNYPLDLSLGTAYLVVVAYDVRTGSSKLWVNPASGGSWVNAIDPVLPTPINAFGLRQPGPNGGIGDSRIDNLLVGLSFEDVTPNLARLRIRRGGDTVEVSWPASGTWAGYVLESTASLAQADWRPVTEPVAQVDDWAVVMITNPTGNEFFRLKKP